MKEADQNLFNDVVYDGKNYWDKFVLDGLVSVETEYGTMEEYEDGPDSLYESLVDSTEEHPGKTCIVDDDGTVWKYKEFLELVDRFAQYLENVEMVRKGMHIGILLYNSVEFFAGIYAINKLRAVAVTLSTKYKKEETLSLAEKADLNGMLCEEKFIEWFRDQEDEMFCISPKAENIRKYPVDAERNVLSGKPQKRDVAVLMFTSGTTSRSKGVVLRNYNLMHAISVYQKIFKIVSTDSTILPVPAYHVTGLIAVGGLFLHAGGSLWIHRFFDAERVLKEMEKQKLTFFHASPTVFTLLLEELEKKNYKLFLRILACGSGNMPVKKITGLKKYIPTAEFRTVYGLTETSSPATILPEAATKTFYKGSAGCPVPGTQFKICDDGNTLSPLGIGTIMIRGTNVTEEYYKMNSGLICDGWLNTGDLGYFNEEGYLFVVDRKKDMINRGGEKICSYDVENLLYEIPGIQEAAVVGIPDEKYGEVPVAAVVLKETCHITETEVKERLKIHLAKFQIPVKILFIKKLPLTPNMKVDKRKIRELFC